MPKASDPYYNRKPVPDELIKDVGLTGLSPEEEHFNREKKYTAGNGVDVRRFSDSLRGGMAPQSDPYYGRKQVSKAEIHSVGDTGLSAEEEYMNRERKYSVGGHDIRKFSRGGKNSLEPSSDPYYSRKKITDHETKGVGELDDHMTPAEQYDVRERKQSLFQLSDDPFDIMAARNRQSISGAASGASAAATRRRSSAVAPDAAAAAAGHKHSGYDGGNNLETIVSRADRPPAGSHNGESSASGHISEDTGDSIDPIAPNGQHQHSRGEGHTRIYDAVTSGHQHGSDSVAPHEVR